MLLEGKKLLITGVLTPQSIAFGIAEMVRLRPRFGAKQPVAAAMVKVHMS